MESGGTHNEEETCFRLAQRNALDGFLYRTLRWNWLFNTGADIVIITRVDAASIIPPGSSVRRNAVNSQICSD